MVLDLISSYLLKREKNFVVERINAVYEKLMGTDGIKKKVM